MVFVTRAKCSSRGLTPNLIYIISVSQTYFIKKEYNGCYTCVTEKRSVFRIDICTLSKRLQLDS